MSARCCGSLAAANACHRSFNNNSSLLACSSDKGTIHIFKLKREAHDDTAALPSAAAAASAAATGALSAPLSGTSVSAGGAVGIVGAGTTGVVEAHEPPAPSACVIGEISFGLALLMWC